MFLMSEASSSNEAFAAPGRANSIAPSPFERESAFLAISRERRRNRLRSTDRAATFFDTTIENPDFSLGRSPSASEKNTPPCRRFILNSLISARVRRMKVGLEREARATLTTTTRECATARCGPVALSKPMRLSALPLFRLIGSLHVGSIPHYGPSFKKCALPCSAGVLQHENVLRG
jgi:hypothetical protein